MPKSNFEIKTFNRGIVAKPEDELDIPQDAASYSLNIDPQTDGALQGIPTDKNLKGSGFGITSKLETYVQGGVTAQSQGPMYTPPPPQEE